MPQLKQRRVKGEKRDGEAKLRTWGGGRGGKVDYGRIKSLGSGPCSLSERGTRTRLALAKYTMF